MLALAIAAGALGLIWLLSRKTETPPEKPQVQVPTVSKTADGRTVVTPVPGAPGKPTEIPASAETSPYGQIRMYNPTTGISAWTDPGNVPALTAYGWVVVTGG